jgi:hypothetical protein
VSERISDERLAEHILRLEPYETSKAFNFERDMLAALRELQERRKEARPSARDEDDGK